MISILSDSLWKELRDNAIDAKKRTVIVAYFSDSSVLPFESTDYLVIDASDDSIKSGKTDAKAIQELFHKGVHIYSHNNLHGKMFIFDEIVVVGSPNISHSSQNKLTEIAVLIKDPKATLEAHELAHTIINQSRLIDRLFLNRILKIDVDASKKAPLAIENNKKTTPLSNVWILETPPPGNSKLMRAYFIALIQAQIGGVIARKKFLLWPKGHFSGHQNSGKLVKTGRYYELTKIGVDYFNSDKVAPNEELYLLFLHAVETGNFPIVPEKLKSQKMKKMLLWKWYGMLFSINIAVLDTAIA